MSDIGSLFHKHFSMRHLESQSFKHHGSSIDPVAVMAKNVYVPGLARNCVLHNETVMRGVALTQIKLSFLWLRPTSFYAMSLQILSHGAADRKYACTLTTRVTFVFHSQI